MVIVILVIGPNRGPAPLPANPAVPFVWAWVLTAKQTSQASAAIRHPRKRNRCFKTAKNVLFIVRKWVGRPASHNGGRNPFGQGRSADRGLADRVQPEFRRWPG